MQGTSRESLVDRIAHIFTGVSKEDSFILDNECYALREGKLFRILSDGTCSGQGMAASFKQRGAFCYTDGCVYMRVDHHTYEKLLEPDKNGDWKPLV